MPTEILSLVLHRLDVGDANNRADLVAQVISCKALKLGVAMCSVEVKLQGKWSADQLAGTPPPPAVPCASSLLFLNDL